MSEHPAMPVPPATRTNTKAKWALALGILGVWPLVLIGSIFAIRLGRQAQREIASSGGSETGLGIARAGIILGWTIVGVVMAIVLAFCAYAFSCGSNCG